MVLDGDQFVGIPSGWEVAPVDDPNVPKMCEKFTWQTQCVVLDGCGFYTQGVRSHDARFAPGSCTLAYIASASR